MIDSKTAARIAREHGLSLSDAVALAKLAEDEREAEELAELFRRDEEQEDPAKLAARVRR
jgi:hypothetical protein